MSLGCWANASSSRSGAALCRHFSHSLRLHAQHSISNLSNNYIYPEQSKFAKLNRANSNSPKPSHPCFAIDFVHPSYPIIPNLQRSMSILTDVSGPITSTKRRRSDSDICNDYFKHLRPVKSGSAGSDVSSNKSLHSPRDDSFLGLIMSEEDSIDSATHLTLLVELERSQKHQWSLLEDKEKFFGQSHTKTSEHSKSDPFTSTQTCLASPVRSPKYPSPPLHNRYNLPIFRHSQTIAWLHTTASRRAHDEAALVLGAPKKPLTAWQMFLKDELSTEDMRKQLNTASKVKKWTSDASIRFDALDEATAHPYKERARLDRVRFSREVRIYIDSLPQTYFKDNARKELVVPKKYLTAFLYFLKAIRSDDALRARVWDNETEPRKQSTLAATEWRNMTDADKAPYTKLADADKERYNGLKAMHDTLSGLMKLL